MKTNLDVLKQMDASDFALAVIFDKDGEMRTSCAICQRHIENNCDDNCFGGVYDYLTARVENETKN